VDNDEQESRQITGSRNGFSESSQRTGQNLKNENIRKELGADSVMQNVINYREKCKLCIERMPGGKFQSK
jgi:hypothetical protein